MQLDWRVFFYHIQQGTQEVYLLWQNSWCSHCAAGTYSKALSIALLSRSWLEHLICWHFLDVVEILRGRAYPGKESYLGYPLTACYHWPWWVSLSALWWEKLRKIRASSSCCLYVLSKLMKASKQGGPKWILPAFSYFCHIQGHWWEGYR